jgi:6-pyruvoyltetrahydropterin/6-carboxytetrahydropterin synthase
VQFTLTKRFSFEAAHRLLGLGKGHPCADLHGPSYRVEVVVASPDLDRRGFAGGVDYRDLDAFKRVVDGTLDHATVLAAADPLARFLREEGGKVVLLAVNPTAENLAAFLYREAARSCPAVTEVRVSETAKTWASYKP